MSASLKTPARHQLSSAKLAERVGTRGAALVAGLMAASGPATASGASVDVGEPAVDAVVRDSSAGGDADAEAMPRWVRDARRAEAALPMESTGPIEPARMRDPVPLYGVPPEPLPGHATQWEIEVLRVRVVDASGNELAGRSEEAQRTARHFAARLRGALETVHVLDGRALEGEVQVTLSFDENGVHSGAKVSGLEFLDGTGTSSARFRSLVVRVARSSRFAPEAAAGDGPLTMQLGMVVRSGH